MRIRFPITLSLGLALLPQAPAQDELYGFTSGKVGTQLGVAVALDGALAAAGAPVKERVNLFDVSTGQKTLTLTASDGEAFDFFGTAIALDGGRALVGARFDDDKGRDSGSAYLFDAATGQELLKLRAPDGQPGDTFGTAVDLQGNLAIVGAPGHDGVGGSSGAAYVFDLGTGSLLFEFEGKTGDFLGSPVVLDGTRALVGSTRIGLPNDVFVYDLTTGQLLTKLASSDGMIEDGFATAIATDGDRAVVGSFRHDEPGLEGAGAAYVFDLNSGLELFKLTPADGEAFDFFGAGVGIEGDLVAVSARHDDDQGEDAGAVYLFDAQTGQELVKLRASDPGAAALGTSLALDGAFLLAGAPYSNSTKGAVYVFEPCPTVTKYCGAAQNPANAATIGIDTCQSASASIELRLSNAPDGQPAYLLVGDGNATISQPPGSVGDLCVAGGTCLGRFDKDVGLVQNGLFVTDVRNAVSTPCGGAFAIAPGTTWSFQFWHRQPGGQPSTFSEALRATFQ